MKTRKKKTGSAGQSMARQAELGSNRMGDGGWEVFQGPLILIFFSFLDISFFSPDLC